jgi:hypothetical protein
MEDDIPLYHFDVSPEEMRELIADPDGFVVRLGLRPDEDHEYRKVIFASSVRAATLQTVARLTAAAISAARAK